MESGKELSKRLEEVLLNGKWIAPVNYKSLLNSITWTHATTQIGSLNTIAKLIFHINYYISGLIEVFEGGELTIKDKYSFDLQPINSEDDWHSLVSVFLLNAEKFVSYVNDMSDDELNSPFVEVKYGTVRRSIEGVLEHNYYHLGQLSLIRKMVLEKRVTNPLKR